LENRRQVLDRLNTIAPTRDTPRGLVITVPDASFEGAALRTGWTETLARVAAVANRSGLRIWVEGHSDLAEGATLSERREEAVRSTLLRNGLDPAIVQGRNLAAERPLISNSSAGGRATNRRVEIVISGETIGARALWDRSYAVTLR
jgi:flagellar motor protein MotB